VKPWYETAFGSEYLELYPHRGDAEARNDVQAIIDLIGPPKSEPLLDLGCGAARHLLALHAAGFRQLFGLDLSRDLLAAAAQRISEEGAQGIELIRSDMRHIPFEGRFSTILSIFTSFGYFESDGEDAKVVRGAYAALKPGGQFLLDTLGRAATISALVREEVKTIGARTLHIRRRLTDDGLRVEKETRVSSDGSEVATFRESVRMYRPDELIGMFSEAGFEEIRTYGSVAGEAHDETSPRLVVVARKPRP